ncbi:MAG TPA: DUF3105 domain-containing protein [Gemmatimonadota bacterium]|nr:DUF3105 domain-containing protein [Gemmatimonadota bacterium]
MASGRRGTRQRRTVPILALIALLVIGAAVGVLAARTSLFGARTAEEAPGARLADQGNLHIPTLDAPHEPYNSDPPTSGPHVGYIAPWGVHTRPIPRELQVHNLEDGGVLVQYSCDCPDVVDKLAAIVRKYDRFVILAPYPAMKSRIALTAWTRIDTMEEVDAPRITRFIEAYRGLDHHPVR